MLDSMLPTATFSIVARCPATGELGVAVSSAVPCVGAICPFGAAGVGVVASQAWSNPYLGIDALRLLRNGNSAEEALLTVVGSDPGREKRQVILVDRLGQPAGHTGTETSAWHGHRLGEGFAVAGNLLAGPEVLTAMAEAFMAGEGTLADRLVRALEAGQAAGGDRRGKESAALLVVKDEEYPWLDVRVDDHPDPVGELRRVYEIVKVKLLAGAERRPRRRSSVTFGAD